MVQFYSHQLTLKALVSPLLLCCLLLPFGSLAILCRTGVDFLGGPVASCAPGHQCLNTTSAQGQTVYSCDFGGICETILNLRDGCMRDGDRMVCCCSTRDGCNFGLGPFVVFRNESKVVDKSKQLNNAALNLKSPAALDFLKKLETGSSF